MCGQEVRHLVPRGWSKVDLFDKHNRVLSGRWKVLVRVLPVRPGLTSREINTIPQVTVEQGPVSVQKHCSFFQSGSFQYTHPLLSYLPCCNSIPV